MKPRQEYMQAMLTIAGPQLQDLVGSWNAQFEGRYAEASELSQSTLTLPDRLSPSERAQAVMGCIRLMHLQTVQNRTSIPEWPPLPHTGLHYSQFPQLDRYPGADMTEEIIDLTLELYEREISFEEQMLCEILELTRHRNGRQGVFGVALVEHILVAARNGPSEKFRYEFAATHNWLRENGPWHREDYWAAYRAEALARFGEI